MLITFYATNAFDKDSASSESSVASFNKSNVLMSSTPKKIEETADIPCQLLRKLFKSMSSFDLDFCGKGPL